ncbi:MAG TPA: hypothetical protein EYM96_09170 [Rhodospirillales bacterium]|nr:hypothetical protein [Rhodospirillales bacterium]
MGLRNAGNRSVQRFVGLSWKVVINQGAPALRKPGPLFLNKRTSRQAPLFLDYYWLVMVIKGIFSGLGGVTG